jgi:SP family sugar:H+ symporter-like MFS transporter
MRSPLFLAPKHFMYGLSPAIGILDIMMGKLSKFKRQLPFRHEKATSDDGSQSEKKPYAGAYDNSPVPRLTIHSFIMGVFVSMGGFIFGYDTGQISGFLGMENFQRRFGQRNSDGSGYHFSNVRSGLIVALVSILLFIGGSNLTFYSYPLALSWEL